MVQQNKKLIILTDTLTYSDGFYFRKGDRIYLLPDRSIPSGIKIIPKTKRKEKNVWANLLKESKDGVSFKVEGWVKYVAIK